jgi:hypothetical protein
VLLRVICNDAPPRCAVFMPKGLYVIRNYLFVKVSGISNGWFISTLRY